MGECITRDSDGDRLRVVVLSRSQIITFEPDDKYQTGLTMNIEDLLYTLRFLKIIGD